MSKIYPIEPEELKTTHINIPLTPSLRRVLDQLARQHNMKTTPFARKVLRGYVKQHEKTCPNCQSEPPKDST